MKVRRRIVLVYGTSKRPLAETQISFIQTLTQNNLGEVLGINANEFTLTFGGRKVRESDIERSLLVCTSIRDHIEGLKFGLSYGLVSVTVRKDGAIKLEGPLTKKIKELNSIASLGHISVDESIIKIYSRIVDIRHLKVKEKDVYNVFGFKEVPSRIRGLKETYGKLIGRDKEFKELENLIYQIAADQGQIAGVVGEAGIGKTRFTHELKNLLAMRGLQFYEGTFPYFGGSSYKGFKDIISAIANISHADPIRTIEKKLKRIGLKYDLEDSDVNFLINLYSIISVSDTLKHLDEEQIKLGTFVAIKKLIFAMAENPLIIILEDMQNADELSAKLADFLAEGLPEKKLLFYMNYRPEFHGECEKKIYFNKIELQRFDEAKAKEFLISLLDVSIVPKQILRLILKKSAGNPLYIEELVRSLLDKGKIKVINNALQLADEIEIEDIQPTVHGVISYRMEKLEPKIRKTLQWGSAIGDEIDIKLLKTILSRDISKDIEELEIRDFIVEKSIYPEEIYRFRHDLIREVAYESLSPDSRKNIHLKIAKYLEGKHKRELDEHVEEIANHFIQSSDHQKGFDYAFRAAQKLKDNYANEKAIALFEQAYELVDKANEKDRGEMKKKILEEIREVCVVSSKYEKAFEIMTRYKKLLKKDDKLQLAVYKRLLGDLHGQKGDHASAINLLEESLHLAEGLKERKEILKSLDRLTSYHSLLLNKKETEKYAGKALRLITKDEKNEQASIYNMLGHVYAFEGNCEKAIKFFEKSIRVYKNLTKPDKLATVFLNVGIPYYKMGDFHKSFYNYQKSLELSKLTGNISRIGLLYQNIAVLNAKTGNIKRSLSEYYHAKKMLEETGYVSALSMVNSNLAFTYQRLGAYKTAREYLKESNKLLQKSPNKFWVATNFNIDGKLERSLGNYDKAQTSFEQALTIFEEIENYSQYSIVLSELIELYIRQGKIAQLHKLVETTKSLGKKHLAKEGYEALFLSTIKLETALNRNFGLPHRNPMPDIDKLSHEHKFDILASLSRHSKKILKDDKASKFYATKAINLYNDLMENVPENFLPSLKNKKVYKDFLKEFSFLKGGQEKLIRDQQN